MTTHVPKIAPALDVFDQGQQPLPLETKTGLDTLVDAVSASCRLADVGGLGDFMMRGISSVTWSLTVCAIVALVPPERGFAQDSGTQYSITIQNEIKSQEAALLQRIQALSQRMRDFETNSIKELSRLAERNLIAADKLYDDYVERLLDTGFNLIGGAIAGQVLNKAAIMVRLDETKYLNGLGELVRDWSIFLGDMKRASAGTKEFDDLFSRFNRELEAMSSELRRLTSALRSLEREKASLRRSGRLPPGPSYDPVLDTFTMQAPDRSIDFSPGSWDVFFDLEDTSLPEYSIDLSSKSDAASMLQGFLDVVIAEPQEYTAYGLRLEMGTIQGGLMEASVVVRISTNSSGEVDEIHFTAKRIGETFVLIQSDPESGETFNMFAERAK